MALIYHDTPFHATHRKEIADQMAARADLIIAIEKLINLGYSENDVLIAVDETIKELSSKEKI